MNAQAVNDRDQVTGIVRNKRDMKDGTTQFSVSGKGFKRTFSLPQSSVHSSLLKNNVRVVVMSTDSGRKHPKVERILYSPTGYQVAEAVAWVSKKAPLPV